MSRIENNITIEGARIMFRNFSGLEGRFNPAGNRNFCWLIEDPALADGLMADGWNIRHLPPRDEGDEPVPYMQVSVKFRDTVKPKIVLVTSTGKKILDEETVNILDWAEIKNVDMIIRPYNWNVSGKSGVKGYLKTMYVTIKEDEFESKYADVPDSAISSLGAFEEAY